MAEISFNAVFDAVTTALHKAFPGAHVFGETVKQGLSPGDFNVLPIKGMHEKALGLRSKRVSTFDVIFYPTDEGGRAECLEIAQALPEVLGSITTSGGDKLYCGKFDVNITDDVLHCIVSYTHFVYVPKDDPEMKNIEIKEVTR